LHIWTQIKNKGELWKKEERRRKIMFKVDKHWKALENKVIVKKFNNYKKNTA
jgi:hypothetical protein